MKKEHPYINPYFTHESGELKRIDETIYQNIAEKLGDPSPRPIMPFTQVLKQGEEIFISLFLAGNKATVADKWTLVLEDGSKMTGKVYYNSITLPNNLPLGYHELKLKVGKETQVSHIIITPERTYQPEALKQGKKMWGTFFQLYTLRSDTNWGIGDFSDLQVFLQKIAAQGGDFVGLNPIHSLFPSNPESASPYSPSSRLWQNIIYIDVNKVEAFKNSKEAQQWFNSAEIQQQLAEARAKDFVDYAQVTKLKLEGLRLAFSAFLEQDQTAFEEFIAQSGESLKIQGTFEALHQWLSEQFKEQWGWNFWDKKYQDYKSRSVAKFQKDHSELVRFYMWLQFVAQEQLKACNKLAQKLKMPIGFYRDLAVGVADNGAETWADKELFVLDASVGAPPDILGPNGQNWGLSPMHPEVLQKRGFKPYIELLRSNMKNCGALRIDHILGFARMWWVAKGDSAKNGVYVTYPLEEMLSILALESQRHQCLIIAEALGTVPEGMLEALEEKGILAYNIFYFEFENEASKPLENYPYQAMTTLSTHNLPTIKGYWQSYDFELGEKFDVYPNPEVLAMLKKARVVAKERIRKAVEDSGIELEADSDDMSQNFAHQLQTYVADTNSVLYGTQPEDWINMFEPVNIPGTSSEYPNWRRKLSCTTEEIFADEKVLALLKTIDKKRHG